MKFVSILYLILLHSIHSEFIQIVAKKSQNNKNCSIKIQNNTTSLSMGNCKSIIYYIQLGIGTPPQLFNFQLDTSTQLTWFPIKNGFKFQQSSTVQISPQKRTAHYHNQKDVEGYAGSDYVSLQQTNISARSAILWVDQNVHILFQPQISGIVGLGFSQIPNIFDRAYEQGQISSSIFTLQISDSQQDSKIYYNIIPQQISLNTYYVPIIGEEYWMMRLRGFSTQQNDFSKYSTNSIILDSRINQIKLNEDLYEVIKQEYFVNCSTQSKLNLIFCSCDQKFPKFSFLLDKLQVFLDGNQYIQKVKNSQNCLVKIGKDQNIVLGNIFFKQYVLTFDKQNKRIGFKGDLLPVHFIGSQYFQLTQYIVMSIFLFIIGFGLYLIYYLKIEKYKVINNKTTACFIQLP